MHLKSLFTGTLAALSMTVGAHGQALLDGSSVDEILSVARNYGSATMETPTELVGRTGGINYWVYFLNCGDGGTGCEDVRFYTAFCNYKTSMEAINEWNRETRWGRAYLDSELDAALDYDLNLVHGVSRANLDSTWDVWSTVLGLFVEHIGFDGSRCS